MTRERNDTLNFPIYKLAPAKTETKKFLTSTDFARGQGKDRRGREESKDHAQATV